MRLKLQRGIFILGLIILGLLALSGNAAAQAELFLCTGILCIIPVIILVVFILIAIWVYRDAESRGMSGVLWLIVVILLSWIGLIIYFVVRKPKLSPGVPPGAYPPPGGYPPRGGQYPPPPPR